MQYNRPAGTVQLSCHSAAMSADVDVLFPARPTPLAVVHVLFPALLSPGRWTPAVAVVQSVPALCPIQVRQ